MSVRSGPKIAFMGAGGTGKTTDAKVIGEKTGIRTLKSSSRIAYEELGISEADCLKMSGEEKWELQERIFTLKQTNDDETFEFIADRTLLDHWAYCLMYCGTVIPPDKFNEFENNVRKHMRGTYTHMFYYPWGYWTPKDEDGVRQAAPGWQSAIDAILVGYCVRWNLPIVQVPQHQGPEARQEFVLNTILGKQNDKS